jgi:hypothetical protein
VSKPTIHGKRHALSASSVLDAIARDLSEIKADDRLTFADLGRILGKSDDQAAKYCDGTAEMSVTTYAFARERWNGRFTGRLDRLIGESRGETMDDRTKESCLLKAALALSLALADDDLSDDEIKANRKTLEEAADAIDHLLRRLGPKGALA